MLENKTLVILGANGFVGSYLVKHFAAVDGIKIRAFDRFSRDPTFSPQDNIEVVKGDIFNDEDVTPLIASADYVVHSFSATTPFTADNNPYADVEGNLLRSIEIFELCAKSGVKKVGFISSGGAVYGAAAENGKVDETTLPLPVSPYGINKLAIEYYLEYFKRKYQLDYIAYRLANPYGPGQRSNKNQGVIPTFLSKVANKEPITIYGDGTTSRDYIHMDDAAQMILMSFEGSNQYPVYNIGSGQQTSLNAILEIMRSTVDMDDTKIEYKEAPVTFLNKTQISIDRFRREFGDVSLTPFEEGLEKTIRSYLS